MPFKSKKKKKSAKKRHISISEQGLAVYKPGEVSPKEEGQKSAVKSKISTDNYSYVKKEVRIILTLSLLIIGLQLILGLSNITFR